jgi:DNA mismatch repair protein MutS
LNEQEISKYTPMMQQYLKIKEDYSDFIVFFRLGDFYEMFFQDAIIASKELEIVLTGRDAGQEERVPMCGVPYHAVSLYLEKLVEKRYKVAIVEQVEDPELAKGIVKREVVKLITPGTIIDAGLEKKDNNYICAIYESHKQYILAFADLSTGELFLEILPKDQSILLSEVMNLNAKEIVIQSNFKNKYLKSSLKNQELTISINDNLNLKSYYKSLVNDVYDKELLNAFALLINYLELTQKQELLHLQKCIVFESNAYLRIDNNSKRNLELTETLLNKSTQNSLFWLLDKCATAMGSRMLKSQILRPLIEKEEIVKRHCLVEKFNDNFIARQEIITSLKEVYDLERIVGRVSFGSANAKDMINLKRSLFVVPKIRESLRKIDNEYALEIASEFPDLEELKTEIEMAIVDNPPMTIKEGNFIKPGYSKELDEMRQIKTDAKAWLESFVEKEKERTGIKKLKIGYNRVFGYFIEVTKSQMDLVKDEFGYERKQTLSNSERFITKELKEKEAIILGSEDSIIEMEYELFLNLRNSVNLKTYELQKCAKLLALVDMIIAFSVVSMNNRYIRPEIKDNHLIEVINGRHPVVEVLLDEVFVENSLHMDENNSILLITGPNMSGKSTYMRQLALTVIMAQIGCFVPAERATLPIFDQIFTRIGASDDLSTGKSTFMVEMLEVNYALQNATEKSLILFDEIGRGTATYDGMALAQAIIEYCHHKINCKILFSTHYHELTYLEEELKSLKNVHVKAKEEKGNIVFLHKVVDGPTDKSYGIHVAKLAKMPKNIINRADQILEELEKNHGKNIIKPQTIDLFNYMESLETIDNQEDKYQSIIDQIKDLDILDITPISALNILNDIIEEVKKKA